MGKWITLPDEPLYGQKEQLEFINARRARICKDCGFGAKPDEVYLVDNEVKCPNCDSPRAIRVWDKLAVIAGRRFGKSRLGSIAGTQEASIPNTIGWACAPTNPKLHRYVIPAFQKLIKSEWVADYNSEFQDLRLKNGSLIHFQTLQDPDQGRGQGLDWLWIDEICELTKAHWDVIRPSLYDKQGVVFITTTPKSYDWVYEEFYKKATEGVPGFWAVKAHTINNPKFREPEYAAALEAERKTMSDEMFRQEYEADFVNFTGAVYGNRINPLIIRPEHEAKFIKDFIPEWPNIDPWRSITIGIDTGADHPFGAVKIVATESGLFVIDEYLERERSFHEHAFQLKQMAGINPCRYAINKNEKQPMIEFAQHGIHCIPAQNDQLAGIERVKSWLEKKQIWFVESRVPKTIQQMQSLRWAEERKDGQSRDRALVYKKYDELPDCVRYALMSWPAIPTPKPVKKERDISKLPGELQTSIERMRRIDSRDQQTTPLTLDKVGDFWA